MKNGMKKKKKKNVDDEAKKTSSNGCKENEIVHENSYWKPNLFNTLLSYVVSETVKRSSICQCIIKALLSRTALPALLFGLFHILK